MKPAKPIFYTPHRVPDYPPRRDLGPDKLYELCEIAREGWTEGGYNIGCVIARPFIGDKAVVTSSTGNRHDRCAGTRQRRIKGRKLVDENRATWCPSVRLPTSTPTAASLRK